MATIRSRNRFGKRFIRLQELRDYVVDLDLYSHPLDEFECLPRSCAGCTSCDILTTT